MTCVRYCFQRAKSLGYKTFFVNVKKTMADFAAPSIFSVLKSLSPEYLRAVNANLVRVIEFVCHLSARREKQHNERRRRERRRHPPLFSVLLHQLALGESTCCPTSRFQRPEVETPRGPMLLYRQHIWNAHYLYNNNFVRDKNYSKAKIFKN